MLMLNVFFDVKILFAISITFIFKITLNKKYGCVTIKKNNSGVLIMKTYFHIENKEFVDYLKLTANDKTYYFCDDLTIEFDDCEKLDIVLEFIRAEDYYKIKSKNLFLKLLINILKWILSPLMFFIDNDDGIRIDKGFKTFNPFKFKKSFYINSPDEKKVNINYIESKYDKSTKKYTAPLIEIQADGVIYKTEEIKFSDTTLKQEWNTYHLPAFTIILIIILLLNLLNFSLFAQVIREILLYPISENVGGIIGMSFCSLIMIAMFVAYIVVIVKSYRLQKEVINKNI